MQSEKVPLKEVVCGEATEGHVVVKEVVCGEATEGDVVVKEVVCGEAIEGDVVVKDVVCGEATEGDVVVKEVVCGEATEGDVVVKEVVCGEATEGDAGVKEVVCGEATEGDAVVVKDVVCGEATEGDVVVKEVVCGEATEGDVVVKDVVCGEATEGDAVVKEVVCGEATEGDVVVKEVVCGEATEELFKQSGISSTDLQTCGDIIRLLLAHFSDMMVGGFDVECPYDMSSDATVQIFCQSIIHKLEIESHFKNVNFDTDVISKFCCSKITLQDASKIVKGWQQSVCPLDIPLLIHLTDETEIAAKQILDKDVTILVGPTGVGKSTTIHYLCGSSFTGAVGEDGDEILVIEPSALVDVSTVKTATSMMSSTTRFIKPIVLEPLVLERLNAVEIDRPLILCDAPGFGDTNGPEMDISNGIGITRSLQCSKGVRIIVVVSDQIGDQGQYFVKIVEKLSTMMNDIDNYIDSISYCFTKWAKPNLIQARLKNISKAVSSKDPHSHAAKLLKSVTDSISSELCFINPLDKEARGKSIDYFQKSKLISNPNLVFKDFVCEESMLDLVNQLAYHERTFLAYLNKEEYPIVRKLLAELRIINCKIATDVGSRAIRECCWNAARFIHRKIEEYSFQMARFDEHTAGLLLETEQKSLRDNLNSLVKMGSLLPIDIPGELTMEVNHVNASLMKIERLALKLSECFKRELKLIENENYILTDKLQKSFYAADACLQECFALFSVLKTVYGMPGETVCYVSERLIEMNTILSDYGRSIAKVFIDNFDVEIPIDRWVASLNAMTVLDYLIRNVAVPESDIALNLGKCLGHQIYEIERRFEILAENSGEHSLTAFCFLKMGALVILPKDEIVRCKLFGDKYLEIARLVPATVKSIVPSLETLSNKLIESRAFCSQVIKLELNHLVAMNPTKECIDFKRIVCLVEIFQIINDVLLNVDAERIVSVAAAAVQEEIHNIRWLKLAPERFWFGFYNAISSSGLTSFFHLTNVEESTRSSVTAFIQEIAEYFKVIEEPIGKDDEELKSLTSLDNNLVCYKIFNDISQLSNNKPDFGESHDADTGIILVEYGDKFTKLAGRFSVEINRLASIAEKFLKPSFLFGEFDASKFDADWVKSLFSVAEFISHIRQGVLLFVVESRSFVPETLSDCWKLLTGVIEASEGALDFSVIQSSIEKIVKIGTIMNKLSCVSFQKEIKVLLSECQEIFVALPTEVLENIKSQSIVLCQILYRKVDEFRDGDISRIIDMRSIIFQLVPFDSMFSMDQFRTLLTRLSDLVHSRTTSLVGSTKQFIRDENFVDARTRLDELKHVSTQDYSSCVDLIESLLSGLYHRALDKLKDLNSLSSTNEQITVNKLDEMSKLLQNYIEFCSVIASHFDASSKAKQLKSDFAIFASQRCDYNLVKDLFSQYNFLSLEKELMLRLKLLSCLKECVPEDRNAINLVASRCEGLEEKINGAINECWEALFANSEKTLHYAPAKEIIERLENCSGLPELPINRQAIYRDFVAQYSKNVVDMLRQSLLRGDDVSLQLYEDQVNYVGTLKPLVPNEVWEAIDPLFQQAQSEIKNERVAIERKMEEIELSKDLRASIDQFCEFGRLREYKRAATLKGIIVHRIKLDFFDYIKDHLRPNFQHVVLAATQYGKEVENFIVQLDSLSAKLKCIERKYWVYEHRDLKGKVIYYFIILSDGKREKITCTPEIKKSGEYCRREPNEALAKLFSGQEIAAGLRKTYESIVDYLLESVSAIESMVDDQLDLHVKAIHDVSYVLSTILEHPEFMEFKINVVDPMHSRLQRAMKRVGDILLSFDSQLTKAFELGDTSALNKLLNTSKRCTDSFNLFIKIAPLCTHMLGLPEFNLDIGYSALQQRLNGYIDVWMKRVVDMQYSENVAFASRSGLDRDKFYTEASRALTIVYNLSALSSHSLKTLGNLDLTKVQCGQHVKNEIQRVVDKLDKLIAEIPFQPDQHDLYLSCNSTYDNLRSIQENFEDPSIREEAKQCTERAKSKFLNRFKEIQREICNTSKDSGGTITTKDVEAIIRGLVVLQTLADKIPCLFSMVDSLIDETLSDLKKGLDGAKRFGLISMELKRTIESNKSNEHINSLLKHKEFEEINIMLRNRKTKTFTVFNVLGIKKPVGPDMTLVPDSEDGILGDDIDLPTKEILLKNFETLDKLYWDLVIDGMRTREKSMITIVDNARSLVMVSRNEYVVQMMAYLFAHWTLHRYTGGRISLCAAVGEDDPLVDPRDSLVQPHAAQIVAIFRLLGVNQRVELSTVPVDKSSESVTSEGGAFSAVKKIVSYFIGSNESEETSATSTEGTSATSTAGACIDLAKHLVQIGTGEGKSVVLAVTSCILAKLGFAVDCACYSKYLSDRDYEDFKFMFDAFGVAPFIKYGTFGSICEDYLNSSGNVRSQVERMICGNHSSQSNDEEELPSHLPARNSRLKVLLIDEVDTFFNKEYYGKLYSPMTRIRHATISAMAKLLWANRNQQFPYSTVKKSPEYAACTSAFGKWGNLLDEVIKGMICDLGIVMNPTYVGGYQVLEGERIGYKEEDRYNPNIVRGYETMFSYMKEHEVNRTITKETMEKELVARLYSGGFSYAEVPKCYNSILGVTGTLKQLVDGPEGQLLRDYGIQKFTYMPSVYGKSKCEFAGNNPRDVAILEDREFFIRINQEIVERIKATNGSKYPRAVFVFFEDAATLEEFFNDDVFIDFRHHAQRLTEKVNDTEKRGIIRAAASSGQIVLLTKSFGRGTDFMCYDDAMTESGGVHVIQTFFSEQVAEEVQIKGRTARQGNRGSYGLVVRYSNLDKFGLTKEAVDAIISSGELYESVNKARNKYYCHTLFPIVSNGIKEIATEFGESMAFKDALRAGNEQHVMDFLVQHNKVEMSAGRFGNSRTIVVVDATGSMSPFLSLAKSTVKKMFSNLHSVVSTSSTSTNAMVQFVVYRNYNASPDRILEWSHWEPLSDNPAKLYAFMGKLRAQDGLGPEAVEIGLSHALSEHAIEPIAQVILIGDRECNPADSIEEYIREYPIHASNPIVKKAKHCDQLVPEFIDKGIPIHAFYLTDLAKDCFSDLSRRTNGKCKALDLASADAATLLTDTVSVRILNAVGGAEMVNEYIRRFAVGYSE